MKKFVIAALVATIAAAPVLADPGHDRNDRGRIEQRHDRDDRDGRFDRHDRIEHRSWARGQRFDRRYAANYRVIGNPRAYHLHDAPRGYRWVRSGNDAVLVGITSGIVASVLASTFR